MVKLRNVYQEPRRGSKASEKGDLLVELRQSILTGRYTPGQVLPTEAELMAHHGMSRYSVRAALEKLVNEGLINRTPGKGSLVRENGLVVGTKVIAFLTQDPRDWLSGGIAAGLQQTLSDRIERYRLELHITGDSPDEFERAIDDLAVSRPDGAVVMPLPWLENHEWAFKLKQSGVPFVVVDNYATGVEIDSVEMDNRKGGSLAAKHLIEQGYRQVYHLGTGEVASCDKARAEGFTRTMLQCCSEIDWCEIVRCPIDLAAESEHERPWIVYRDFWRGFMAENVKDRACPIAVFAVNDFVAYGVLCACTELGLEVGRQVGIIGFDDRELATVSTPRLTTIKQKPEMMGREAAGLIADRLESNDGAYRRIHIEPELVVRESARLEKADEAS